MVSLIKTDGANNDFRNLVDLLNIDLNSRYGTLQDQYNKYNGLDSIHNVIVAYLNESPIGCGSYKKYDTSSVEIKRMFLKLENRGSGIASQILTTLEKWAAEIGYSIAILETGIGQPEAIKFYQKSGYKLIDNFGQYVGNTNSVCMSKNIQK